MPAPTATARTTVPLYPQRAGAPRTIEAAPGQSTVPLPPQDVPRIAVVDLVPTGEPGHYRAIARIHAVELALDTAVLKKLGLGVSTRTMRRLIQAGFVEGTKVAPRAYTFDLASWFAHCARVRAAAAAGRDFWAGENLTAYRTAW